MTSNRPPVQYNETLRIFSITLHSLSPKGYAYVREKFKNNLPHPSTIRTWYANSSNGEPGISKDSLENLKNLVDEYKLKNEEIYCTLAFDEMSMRRHVQWSDTQKKFIGHISYGSIPGDAEYLPVANNALVFMVNGINVPFNVPVAFHFINCLQAHEKAALLKIVLTAVSQTGLKIIVIIFDGLVTNIRTCVLLGATFNVDKNFRPYIINPVTGANVYLLFDPPHMVKLMRNCLGDYKTLYCDDGTEIHWKFFENLVQLQSKCDIVTHKLTKQHTAFERNIMNVALATQTLSESVARSIEMLSLYSKTSHMFENCGGTVRFSRTANNLFDVFNSKDTSDNFFKSAINHNTKEEIFQFLDQTTQYLKSLKLEQNGKSIIYSRRKTGFKGFIINIHTLKGIYAEYVETGKMDSIPMRRLNQDPVESFFGRIRTCCLGNNDNPTVEQFSAAYRKILVASELTSSVFSNCKDHLKILHTPSTHKPKVSTLPIIVRVDPTVYKNKSGPKTNAASIQEINDLLIPKQDTNDVDDDSYSFDGSEITIARLAGEIENKILTVTRSKCEECTNIIPNMFNINEASDIMHIPKSNERNPCVDTLNICQQTNELLRIHAYRIDFNYNLLLQNIKENLNYDDLFVETEFHDNDHKIDLITYIVSEFIRVRATFIARKITLNEKKKLLRRKNLKLVHFAGE